MDKAQKFWDKNAQKYDESEKQFDAFFQEIIDKTKKYLKEEDVVLDFGCGTGTRTIELGKFVKHIHGLDFSSEMINRANNKKERTEAKNVSFSTGTLFSAKFKKAEFDAIVAYSVIHLLEEPERAIRKIYEWLKPGGVFISVTACFREKGSFWKRLEITLYRCMKKLGVFPLQLNLYSASDVEQLIRDQHFRIVHAEKVYTDMTVCFIVAKKK